MINLRCVARDIFVGFIYLYFLACPLFGVSLVAPEKYITGQNDLTITFVDSGQGEAIFIRTPEKMNILIDAGIEHYCLEDGRKIESRAVSGFLKNAGIKKLDVVVFSHSHPDHVSGFVEVLKNLDVNIVYESGINEEESAYLECLDLIREKGIDHRKVRQGDVLDWGKSVSAVVLSPPIENSMQGGNDNSLVIKMTYKEVSVLFCGDIENIAEERVVEQYDSQLKSNILKVPHHGSSSSINNSFLDKVGPEVAVVSCSMDNPFGHPHAETIYRYKKRGIKLFRTDYNGNVSITSDGIVFKVDTDKK